MDMRKYMKPPETDVESNKAVMSFELSGKKMRFEMDGGESLSFAFAPYPTREVIIGDSARGIPYECAKIDEHVFYISYLLPESSAGYVLDMDSGLITRVITDASGKTSITFGSDGKSENRHTFTEELNGYAILWTLGKLPVSIFETTYANNQVSIARPLAKDAQALSVSDFRAVRVNERIIIQVASIHKGADVYNINFVSNFWGITCVGSLCKFSSTQGADYKHFAGYGRILSVNGTKDGDLYGLSPFKGKGIMQITPPLCYELAGESFEFIMDDGYDYALRFIDDKTLLWNWVGDEPKQADYLCMKGDDTSYLVSFELEGVLPRVNHTFVIDKENNLVTRLISKIGTNPKYPLLMKTEYEFGAIRVDGADVPVFPRHGFTSDIIGNIVEWSCGGAATVHGYNSTHFYRLTYSRDPLYAEEAARMRDNFEKWMHKIPSTDEPSTFIKIKDGVYLFTLTEVNAEKILGAEMGGFRSNTMSWLTDFKNTSRTFIRLFGTSTRPDGTDVNSHMMIGLYGRHIDPESDAELKKMLTDPNPFISGG